MRIIFIFWMQPSSTSSCSVFYVQAQITITGDDAAAAASACCRPAFRTVGQSLGGIGRISGIDPVVVTATRTAQPLSQAASSISVVKAKDIEETVPQTFTDTLLDIPNVDVESSSSVMFSRIRIRGSEPNQITYLVDGLRQDDTTAAGNQFIGIFIDPELLKQVEVKRGGGSSLYGNGGIGEPFL